MKLLSYMLIKQWIYCTSLLFILILSAGTQTATAQSETITIPQGQRTILSAFEQIENQTNYNIAYNESVIDVRRTIDLQVTNQPLSEAMAAILKGTNTTYKLQGRQLIIVQAPSEIPDKRYFGVIYDETGQTVVGASIVLKDNPFVGTTSDVHGRFSIEAPVNSVLVVSFIGFDSQEIVLGDQAELNVRLEFGSQLLEEFIVVGYGTQSSRLVSSSITRVSFDEIDKGAEHDPIKLLQGRAPGINISSRSGSPGSSPNVLIRGVSSISGSSSPLYVVDGIPSERYPNLNPNDIESIEVLKDASAAAIYGSRANAGVVLITTKAGRPGETKIEVNHRYGVSTLARDIRMANTNEYINTMRTAIDNYNVQTRSNLSLYIPPNPANTNWVGEISRALAIDNAASINMSGGNEQTTFYTSFGLMNQEGYINTTSYHQYNARVRLGHRINDYIRLNLNLGGAYSLRNMAEEERTSLKVLRTAREEQPWYVPYNEDGTYKVNGVKILRHNPLMLIYEDDWRLNKYQLSSVASIDVTPFDGLSFTSSLSAYTIYDEEKKKLTENHAARAFSSGWSAIRQQKDNSLRVVFDNVLRYTNRFHRLDYSLMAGHSFEKYEYDRFGARSDNYANGAFPSSSFDRLNSGTNIFPASFTYSAYALESYFGRVSLNYDDRYVFNASLRSDGSSRFPKDNRYGFFPSASIAWLIDNEDFFSSDRIDDLKFRLSFGQTGSMANISNWAAMSLVTAGNSYNGSSGFNISQSPQDLEWEKATQYNVGVDVSMINKRISFSADAFYSRTDDMLFNMPTHATTGYTSITANIGSVENRGLEFAMDGDILKGAFNWNLGANISFVQNKLLSLLDGQDMYILPSTGSNLIGGTMKALIVGQPISTFYMLVMDGIYQYDSEVPELLYAKGVRAGDVRYRDLNGDGDISEEDRMAVGKATPDYFGGIYSRMSWRNFDLNVFSQFAVGAKVVSSWKGMNGVEGTEHLGLAFSNVSVPDRGESVEQFFNVSQEAATGFWRGPGTSNTIPRPIRAGAHTGYSHGYNVQTSTRYLEDASYFKIQTVTLGYTIPVRILQNISIQRFRVFFSVDNFLTFTNYSGYDPEVSYSGTPGHAHYGVDFGLQPTLRTFMFGASANF